ncbi:MAG: ABC transporter permease [Actinomycetales bacterium]|nr:ABC transporter permease [Actinomycetales bacterium]
MPSTSPSAPVDTLTARGPGADRWSFARLGSAVGLRGPLRAFGYWLVSYRRTWRGTVVSSFLSPLLYLGAMGFGLGTLVDGNDAGGRLDGVPYAAFLAPGVLAATAMQTAVGESTYPVMGAMKWHRQYHAMLAAPLGVVDLLLGHLAFVLFRVLVSAVGFVLVGAVLGAFTSPWVLAAIPVTLLCGAAHASPVMAYAVRQEGDGGFTVLFRFGLVPMFLFAGTFFPVDQLPAVLRPLAWATPLWHATTLCRGLSLGGLDALPAAGHLGYLALWAAAGLWLALRCYRRRLLP